MGINDLFEQAIAKLLDQMPDELRPLGEVYAAVLRRIGVEGVGDLIRDAITNTWSDAHKVVVLNMSVDEIVAHTTALNAMMAKYNNDNAAVMESQKETVLTLLSRLVVAALA